jgi:hypothetical protein
LIRSQGEDFEPTRLRRGGASLRVLRRDGDGEILLQSVDGEDGVTTDDDIDLVLVDAGQFRSAARIAREIRSVDAMVAVARNGSDAARVEDELDRLGLADLCVALAFNVARGRSAR